MLAGCPRRPAIAAIFVLFLGMGAGNVGAQAPDPVPTPTYYLQNYSELTSGPAAQPWWSLTFDLVIKLGLVIGLIYVTMWVLRRYTIGNSNRRNIPGGQMIGRLGILDTAILAPNRTVYLVEIADRVLVLGATATALSTLAEIREPAAIAMLKHVTPASDEGIGTFSEQFRALADHLPAGHAPAFLQDKVGEIRTLVGNFRRTPSRN